MYQRAWAAAIAAFCIFPPAVMAEDSQSKPNLEPRPGATAEKAQRKQKLLEELQRIRRELAEIDEATPAEPGTGTGALGPARPAEGDAAVELEPIVVLGQLPESTGSRIQSRPAGRAIGTVARDKIDNVTGFSLKEIVEETPGVFLKQGNGPRDVGISIRGSGAKQAFAVRNIKVYEDGFPVTQSDGLSRTDITDPHAYEGVDVIRGPSSALYDNYALGGVVNFRLRRGRDIDGIDLGNDFGSFGYQNHYVHIGGQHQALEYSLFGSHVRGDGWIDNSEFNTTTENLLATYTPDDTRSLAFKFINNDLEARVPSRLTLNELRADPRDAGKTFVNRPTGGGDTVDAELAAQGREDRRTIVGARYEHKLGSATDWRILGTYDVKDINQTFSTIGDNINPNFQMATDLTHRNTLLGFNATHHAGLFFNHMDVESSNFFNRADGVPGRRGALQSQTRGYHQNFGGRVREEVQFSPAWTAVLGVGAETSTVHAELRNRRAAETYDIIDVDRKFLNVAPEAAVIFTPNGQLQVRGRVGTGYGIPGISQLTTTAPNGDPGNNTALDTQTNVGVELGADWQAYGTLGLSLTGYYEFFFDEFVTQFSSVTGQSFTDNAPKAEHRGIEAAIDWHPWDGWRMSTAYTFNDHIYTEFLETIGAGAIRQTLDRSGQRIPGVERHILNARLGYEHPQGVLSGLGGFVEVNWLDDFFINNSNTLEAEGYQVVNLNLHYARDHGGSFARGVKLFFEVQNLFDEDYIASANVQADSPTDTAASLLDKRAFFAGQERSFFGGLKLTF